MNEICVGDRYNLMYDFLPAYPSERILVTEIDGSVAVCKMLDWYGTRGAPLRRIHLSTINALGKKL